MKNYWVTGTLEVAGNPGDFGVVMRYPHPPSEIEVLEWLLDTGEIQIMGVEIDGDE